MINYRGKKVLILAPHCDDETLGCAGIIQRFKDQGSEVHVIVFSFVTGEFRKFDKLSNMYSYYNADQRWSEFESVMEMLKVDKYTVLRSEPKDDIQFHHKLDSYGVGEFLSDLEKYVKEVMEPDVLLIPAKSKNQDHRFVNDLSVTLARPYFLNASILEYEVDGELDFNPNMYVSLTEEEAEIKINAINGHTTQQSGDRHPTSALAQEAKMILRGTACYADYAEAFRVVRIVS